MDNQSQAQLAPLVPAAPVAAPTSFLQALQAQTTQLSQPTPGVGQTSGATERATQILQAKSGKQVNPTGVAQSSIGEQAAAQQAGDQLKSVIQPALQLQQASTNQQAVEQAATATNQQAGIAQTNQFNTSNYKTQLQDLMQQFNQGMGSLSTEKKQAALQQASFLLNMQNQQYVAKLQQIGQMNNLTSKQAMLDQIQNLVFGSEVGNLQTQLGQTNILQASDRQFKQVVSNMSYQDAQNVADMETKYRAQMEAMQAQQLKYGANLESKLASSGAIGQGISGVISGAGQAIQAKQNAADRQQAAEERFNIQDALTPDRKP